MLGRAIDVYAPVLGWNCERHLTFQIEVILATAPGGAFCTARCVVECGLPVTAPYLSLFTHESADIKRLIDGQDWIRRRDIDLSKARRRPGFLVTASNDRENRLAMKVNFVLGQHGVIATACRADIVAAGYIGCSQYRDNTGGFENGGKIYA